MNHNVVVLGCGRVGSAIIRDFARLGDFKVHAVDASESNLALLEGLDRVTTQRADLSQSAVIAKLVKGSDLVIGALPGSLGFAALTTVIEAGINYCDISFMPEDCLHLDGLAKQHKVTAVVDCGAAPGLTNLVVGHVAAKLDHLERVEIYACGLPKIRLYPYEYKAPFSPVDVIEEYTRPARLVENGRIVSKPALSDVDLMDFPEVGTLEAFNTDGLRSLLHTVKATHMKERTLRYPGHSYLMKVLRDSGFFDHIPIEVDGVKVRPIDVTSQLLFPLWAFDEDEEEFTIVRVDVEGHKEGKHYRYTYELYNETDREANISSMARSTGYPAVIVACMILRGEIKEKGVFPPELLVHECPKIMDHMTEELNTRGVVLVSEVGELSY